MKLNHEIRKALDASVLCWLATVSSSNEPNVSPKEIFLPYGEEHLLIANIASPKSVKNIRANACVCVSFVDILVQKGFKLKGSATIIERGDPSFLAKEALLTEMTKGLFPIISIIEVFIESAKPILAPSYLFFPDTSESKQIKNARKAYGL